MSAVSTPKGIAPETLSPWLIDHIDGAEAPLAYELIAGGGSNLTYRVTDAASRAWVLRRPPEGRVLATAHDMAREYRIIDALGNHSDIPVPECVATCDDPSITGTEFYVMSFVDGLILRTQQSASDMTKVQAERATQSLIDNQVMLHTVDLDQVKLSDLGQHHGYVERQLNRWRRQLDGDGRHLPLLIELHERLEASVPLERTRPALAHGDYRFDNTVLGPDFAVAAILDWELCTTGDPIADFVWSLQYWAEAGDEFTWLPDAPTSAPGFCTRSELVERYQRQSGFDLSDLPWYTVFSWWKHACIVEGVYRRRLRGSTGGAPSSSNEAIAQRVDTLLAYANELARDHLP